MPLHIHSSYVLWSVGNLESSQNYPFIFPVGAADGTAVKLRLLVIKDNLDTSVQVPVYAGTPGPGLTGSNSGVGKGGKGIFVHGKVRVAGARSPGRPRRHCGDRMAGSG